VKLEKLVIDYQRWGPHEGKYTGKANFTSDRGTLGIVMSPEVTESFLALAGDLLVAHIEVAGKELQDSVDVAIDRAKLNVRLPEEIARLFAKDAILLPDETDTKPSEAAKS